MSLSYLQTSLDRIEAAARDDVIEICINPDGSCWGEFQGDHFMRQLDQKLTATEVKDLVPHPSLLVALPSIREPFLNDFRSLRHFAARVPTARLPRP